MYHFLNHLRSFGLTLGVAALLAVGVMQPNAGSSNLRLASDRAKTAPVTALADDNGNIVAPKPPPHTGNNGATIAHADDNGNGTTPPATKPGTARPGSLGWSADDNGNAPHTHAIRPSLG